jgi:hypothetical protein
MAMRFFAYAVACVVLPAAWGVLMYYVFGLVQRRRERRHARDSGDPPPIDYSI